MNRLDQIRVAGQIAPIERQGVLSRKVRVVGPDGTVAKEISVHELLQALRKREGVEFGSALPPAERCTICGLRATSISIANARRGKCKPYCKRHKGGPTGKGRLWARCADCGRPAPKTKRSKPYCEQHRRDMSAKARLPCAVCGNPATDNSSKSARQKGQQAYCAEHKGGLTVDRTHRELLLPCGECGQPATPRSSARVRYRRVARGTPGLQAYCALHKRPPTGRRP